MVPWSSSSYIFPGFSGPVELVAVLQPGVARSVAAAEDGNPVDDGAGVFADSSRKIGPKEALLIRLPVVHLDSVQEIGAPAAADDHVPVGSWKKIEKK